MEKAPYLDSLKERKKILEQSREQLIAQLNATLGAMQELDRIIAELEVETKADERPGRPALVDNGGRSAPVHAG